MNQNHYSMKNVHFILAIVCLAVVNAFSQTAKINISAGIGFEPTAMMDKASVNTLPMTLKIGYQLSPMFSLSAFGGYSSTTSTPSYVSDGLAVRTTNQQTFLGLRGELKKEFTERFEMYGGVALGYVNKNITEQTSTGRTYIRVEGEPTPTNPNAANGGLLYAGFIGSTFYIQKHVGLFAELGYGVSMLNGGVTLRF